MSKKAHPGNGPEDSPEQKEESPRAAATLKDCYEQALRAAAPPRPDETSEQPLPAPKIALGEEAFLPGATELLLNAQLLECVAIVRDAGFLYRNSLAQPSERGYFANQAIDVMKASGEVARTIALLKGRDDTPTSRQHYVVEHVNAPGVGGSGKSENE